MRDESLKVEVRQAIKQAPTSTHPAVHTRGAQVKSLALDLNRPCCCSFPAESTSSTPISELYGRKDAYDYILSFTQACNRAGARYADVEVSCDDGALSSLMTRTS